MEEFEVGTPVELRRDVLDQFANSRFADAIPTVEAILGQLLELTYPLWIARIQVQGANRCTCGASGTILLAPHMWYCGNFGSSLALVLRTTNDKEGKFVEINAQKALSSIFFQPVDETS